MAATRARGQWSISQGARACSSGRDQCSRRACWRTRCAEEVHEARSCFSAVPHPRGWHACTRHRLARDSPRPCAPWACSTAWRWKEAGQAAASGWGRRGLHRPCGVSECGQLPFPVRRWDTRLCRPVGCPRGRPLRAPRAPSSLAADPPRSVARSRSAGLWPRAMRESWLLGTGCWSTQGSVSQREVVSPLAATSHVDMAPSRRAAASARRTRSRVPGPRRCTVTKGVPSLVPT